MRDRRVRPRQPLTGIRSLITPAGPGLPSRSRLKSMRIWNGLLLEMGTRTESRSNTRGTQANGRSLPWPWNTNMEFALVNGERAKARPKLRAECPCCRKTLVAKCGPIVRWHWSHVPTRHCDPWWESETAWHRNWKARFPETWREVIHKDVATGEKHIADIKTPGGLTVEFQHSSISELERHSRETFYKSMLWVVHGLKFAKRFHALIALPPPDSDLAKRIHFIRRPRYPLDELRQGLYLNRPLLVTEQHKSDEGESTILDGVTVPWIAYSTGYVGSKDESWTSTSQTLAEIEQTYAGHHYIQWDRPSVGWLASGCHVFIDAGEGVLWELMEFPEDTLCGLAWTTDAFVDYVRGWSNRMT